MLCYDNLAGQKNCVEDSYRSRAQGNATFVDHLLKITKVKMTTSAMTGLLDVSTILTKSPSEMQCNNMSDMFDGKP